MPDKISHNPNIATPTVHYKYDVIPLDINNPEVEQNLLECRGEEIQRLLDCIMQSPGVLIVGTVARSGNTTVQKYITNTLQSRGESAIYVSGIQFSDGFASFIKTIDDVYNSNGKKTVLIIDESYRLVDLEEDYIEKFHDLIAKGIIKPVMFVHDSMDQDTGLSGVETMKKWSESALEISDTSETHLEVMDKAGLAHLFDTHKLHDKFPSELLDAKDEIIAYIWGPLQLNLFVATYLNERNQNSHNEAMQTAKDKVVSGDSDALRDVIGTTAGIDMVNLIRRVGMKGVNINTLNENEIKLFEKYAFTHIFRRENNDVYVDAKCLYDKFANDLGAVTDDENMAEKHDQTNGTNTNETQNHELSDFDSDSIDAIVEAVRLIQKEATSKGLEYSDYAQWSRKVFGIADIEKRIRVVEGLFKSNLWSVGDIAADAGHILLGNSKKDTGLNIADWEIKIDYFNYLKNLVGLDFSNKDISRSASAILMQFLDENNGQSELITDKIKSFARELVNNCPKDFEISYDILTKILQ